MPSFCLNSTNLKGPVPTGLVRICAPARGRIDRRVAGGEQRQDRGLRPLEMDRDLVVAVGVTRSTLPYHDWRGLRRSFCSPCRSGVEGADDVLGREGLAVVPFHACCSLKVRSLLSALQLHDLARSGRCLAGCSAACPGRKDQVVEQGHEGDDRGVGRLLMDRGAGGLSR